METITYLIQGSEPEPYQVDFIFDNNQLQIGCTCQASINNLSCKHRMRIIEGDSTGIIKGDLDKFQTIQSWLKGSEIENAIHKVKEAELNHEKTKKELNKTKKELGRALFK